MGVGVYICFIGESFHGLGKHESTLSVPEFEMFSKWQYFHDLWVMFGVSLVKISIALFLMRLAPRRNWKRFLWGMIGTRNLIPVGDDRTDACIVFLICFTISCAGTLIFSCVPVAAAWDHKLAATAKCFSAQTFEDIGLFNSVINIATDFTFATIPIPIIVKLQVNTRTKITLGIILSLGFFACAAGIVKAKAQADFVNVTDTTYRDTFNLWNALELYLGILAASLPSLKPLFAALLTTTRTALGGSTPRSGRNLGPSGGISHGSGYRRQPEQRNVVIAPSDVHLKEFKSASSTTECVGEKNDELVVGRPYNVRVTSGNGFNFRFPAAGRPSWEESAARSSNESRERLHQPGIIRTTTVTRRSEVGHQ